jgi:hypothetical protein
VIQIDQVVWWLIHREGTTGSAESIRERQIMPPKARIPKPFYTERIIFQHKYTHSANSLI